MASTGPESANKAKAAADAPGDGLVLVNRLSESRSPYVRDDFEFAVGTFFGAFHNFAYNLLLTFCALMTGCAIQVRGHMNNPVAWQEWSPDALELAKKHDRLIFLSVGYAACHCTSRSFSLILFCGVYR